MNFRFTIGRKIGLGFGVIISLFILTFIVTNATLNDSTKTTQQVAEIFNPSVASLKELNNLLNRSKSLITKWFYFQVGDQDPQKKDLDSLLTNEYPLLKAKINALSVNWGKEEQESIKIILAKIDKMFLSYRENIMEPLKTFDDYRDSEKRFLGQMAFDDIEDAFKNINEKLNVLINQQNVNADDNSKQMLRSFDFLKQIGIWLSLAVVLGGILISIYTVRSIIIPVKKLKKMLLLMGKGVLPGERLKNSSDEIGEMSIALDGLIDGMGRTTEFAKAVGAGNFDSNYIPLSADDTLGAALLKMREDLRENERVLEAKVIERTEEVVRQKEEIETKNQELEVLYKHVTDSIKYAKRIQEAILPPDRLVEKLLPNSFVLYKPKDIVSGDFYWVDEKDDKTMFAAVDCTGHGVPGAFMSIVGYNNIKYAVDNNNFTTPALLLDKLNDGVSETLHHGHDEYQAKDGMDISFCTIDYKTLELQFAGAYNPLYIIRNEELILIKGDKFPIGFFLGEKKKKFMNHNIQL